VRFYASKKGRNRTARYFVDRNPVFLSAAADGAAPTVNFAYIDADNTTICGFRSYLLEYRKLFQALGEVRVHYVSNRSTHFAAAAREFEKAAGATREIGRLLEHFEARACHERRDYRGFDTARINRLADELREFKGPRFDALFRVFQSEGWTACMTRIAEEGRAWGRYTGIFRTCLVDHSYNFLGSA
jgi:hypothetical protein